MFKILKAVVALATIQDMAEAINVRINKVREWGEDGCEEYGDRQADRCNDCFDDCEEGNWECWGECFDGSGFVEIKQDTTFDLATTKLADHCHEFNNKLKQCKNWCSSQYKVNGDNDSRPRADCKNLGCPQLCGLY